MISIFKRGIVVAGAILVSVAGTAWADMDTVVKANEIDRLKRLIEILTLARAESGQIALAVAPVDLGGLFALAGRSTATGRRGTRHRIVVHAERSRDRSG